MLGSVEKRRVTCTRPTAEGSRRTANRNMSDRCKGHATSHFPGGNPARRVAPHAPQDKSMQPSNHSKSRTQKEGKKGHRQHGGVNPACLLSTPGIRTHNTESPRKQRTHPRRSHGAARTRARRAGGLRARLVPRLAQSANDVENGISMAEGLAEHSARGVFTPRSVQPFQPKSLTDLPRKHAVM